MYIYTHICYIHTGRDGEQITDFTSSRSKLQGYHTQVLWYKLFFIITCFSIYKNLKLKKQGCIK